MLNFLRLVFCCIFRGKSFLNRAVVVNSGGQTKHQCPKCQRLYSHWHSMTRHLRLECGMPPQFCCPHCEFQSTRKGSINAHIAVKHAVEAEKTTMTQSRYQCPTCKKLFSYKVAMLKHMTQCGYNTTITCSKCEFVAQGSSDLDRHMATDHFSL